MQEFQKKHEGQTFFEHVEDILMVMMLILF